MHLNIFEIIVSNRCNIYANALKINSLLVEDFVE